MGDVGFEASIAAQVTQQQIQITITVYIRGFDTSPESIAFVQACLSRDFAELSPVVFKNPDGHPGSGNHQIGVAIAVDVHPAPIGVQARIEQLWGNLSSNITESAAAVVAQYVSIDGRAVFKRTQTNTHKQVLIAVAIHIGCIHAGGTLELKRGQNLVGFGEVSLAIIEVQTIDQGGRT